MSSPLAPSGRRAPDGAIRPVSRAVVARALTALFALGLGGCVERTLLITTNPTGARIQVNGKDVGLTPATVRFIHNQRFEYRIEKDGYESVAGDVTTPSTWDSVPGLDFVAENVYPGRLQRQTVRHVELGRLPAARSRADLEALLRQAEAFRRRANTETGGPDVPPPSRPGRAPTPTPAPPDPAPSKAGPQGATPGNR